MFDQRQQDEDSKLIRHQKNQKTFSQNKLAQIRKAETHRSIAIDS